MAGIKKTITQTKISQAVDLLQDLPKKVKEEHTLREAIRAMYPTIKGVLRKGYSYPEVAEMLKQADIKISGTTLKQYVQDITKHYKKPNESEVKDKSSSKRNIVNTADIVEDINQNITEDKNNITLDTIETIDKNKSEESIVDTTDIVKDINKNITEDINQDKTDITLDTIETIDKNKSDMGKDESIKPKKLKNSGQTGKTKIESEFNNY